jgi:hypothetical protein
MEEIIRKFADFSLDDSDMDDIINEFNYLNLNDPKLKDSDKHDIIKKIIFILHNKKKCMGILCLDIPKYVK